MTLGRTDVLELVKERLMPIYDVERERLNRIDAWLRWKHDPPHTPGQTTEEYRELSERSQTPWLALVVTVAAQGLIVDGYRRAEDPQNADPWAWWQANGMDSRQVAIHRAALSYGLCYVTVLPGRDDFGEKVPVIRGYSPRRMIALYAEPATDDWPMFAMYVDHHNVEGQKRKIIRVYDDQDIHYLEGDDLGGAIDYISWQTHGIGRVPVIRYANQMDLEGRTPGDVEPFIPVASRIDQTTFDRLVVQRFGAWVIRTVSGMKKPDSATEAAAARLLLKLEDLLIAENADTKFGSIPATPLDGFIAAHDSDIRVLAAVSQTPAHEMLGSIANLSAEALAAARASLTARIDERKLPFGESHERTLRLGAFVMDDKTGAQDMAAQVRWRDTEIRSLSQAADALGKLATMLHVPVELLWEKVPGFTQQDVERAKEIVESGDSISELTALLDRQSVDAGSA